MSAFHGSMSVAEAFAAIYLICLIAVCVLVCVGAKIHKAWQSYRERQATMKRDLRVALRMVEELKLENTMLRVARNMGDVALSVRKRERSLYIVPGAQG
jgi:hypothetical protein